MKHISKYLKNLGKGLATSIAILVVIPILLLAAIIIPLVAAIGQDVSEGQDISDIINLNEEEEV